MIKTLIISSFTIVTQRRLLYAGVSLGSRIQLKRTYILSFVESWLAICAGIGGPRHACLTVTMTEPAALDHFCFLEQSHDRTGRRRVVVILAFLHAKLPLIHQMRGRTFETFMLVWTGTYKTVGRAGEAVMAVAGGEG